MGLAIELALLGLCLARIWQEGRARSLGPEGVLAFALFVALSVHLAALSVHLAGRL